MEPSNHGKIPQNSHHRRISSGRKLIAGLPMSIIKFEESVHARYSYEFAEGPFVGLPWVSHSDCLMGKVVLQPPFTQKCTQAITHQGILELGKEVESKFLNEMTTERQLAMHEQEDFLNRMYDAQIVELIQDVRKEEEQKYNKQMDEVRSFYENKICELLWEGYEQVKVLEDQIVIEQNSLNIIWEACQQREIEDTVKKITEEFLEKLQVQEQILINMFNQQIKDVKTKKKLVIEFEKIKCKEMLIQMKHKLHCQNITNLMYLLCKERRRCKAVKIRIEDDCLAQIRQIRLNINQKRHTIKKLIKVKDNKSKELRVKERCLIEVLRQFQRFMYYALQSAPTRGSFLMNIYKLIKSELEDYCSQKEKLMISRKGTRRGIKVEEVRHDPDIEEFLKYSKYPTDGEEAEYTLPVFYFNQKKFVREDFTNMSCKGTGTSSEHSLWHPEVDTLLNIFRKTIDAKRVIHPIAVTTTPSKFSECYSFSDESPKLQRMKSEHSTVHFDKKKDFQDSSPSSGSTEIPTCSPNESLLEGRRLSSPPPQTTPAHVSPSISKSSRQSAKILTITSLKKSASEAEEEKEINKVVLGEPFEYRATKSPVLSRKSSWVKEYDDFGPRDIGPSPTAQSRLSFARDSLILTFSTMERKSVQLSKSSKERRLNEDVDIDTVQPELEEHISDDQKVDDVQESSMVSSQKSINSKKAENNPTSKLILACDSMEIIKSAITISTGREQSQLTFSPNVSVDDQAAHAPDEVQEIDKIVKSTSQHETVTPKKPPTPKPTPPAKTRITTKAKIVSSRKIKEHEKTVNRFTKERTADLVHMMKKNPSVIPLFTPCL